MTSMDVARQIEAEDLARARERVQRVLKDWDWLTWNVLLADQVVLSLKLGAIAVNQGGGFGAVGGDMQARGREDAKRILESIHGEIRKGLSVITEVISGYDITLLGNLSLQSTKEDHDAASFPVVLYMAFDDEEKIEKMTIAAVDLRPLTDALRTAAYRGVGPMN